MQKLPRFVDHIPHKKIEFTTDSAHDSHAENPSDSHISMMPPAMLDTAAALGATDRTALKGALTAGHHDELVASATTATPATHTHAMNEIGVVVMGGRIASNSPATTTMAVTACMGMLSAYLIKRA